MTVRKPFVEPRLNSVERLVRLEGAVANLEAAVAELLVGLRGVAGSGVLARSQHAREIAIAYQERSCESEAAA